MKNMFKQKNKALIVALTGQICLNEQLSRPILSKTTDNEMCPLGCKSASHKIEKQFASTTALCR